MIHMSKFVTTLAKDTGLSRDEIKNVLTCLVDRLESYAKIGESVSITGFGKFTGSIKPPRLLKNCLGRGKDIMSCGRVAVKFCQYDSRKRELWDESSHAKAFEEE
jgi:nucleoid DNA-binding protein